MCSHPTSSFPSCAHLFPFPLTRPFLQSNTYSVHHHSISQPRSHTHVYTWRGPEAREEWQLARVGLWSERVHESQSSVPSLTCPLLTGPAVEAALCRAVLAPLKPALWMRLRTLRAPELRRLRRRQIALRAGAGPPGAQGAGPEGQGLALRSRIHMRLAHLHAACAPRRKVALLLAVCSDVYAGLAPGENQGRGGVCAYLDVDQL